ncbi:MAG: PLP-dependent transferase [Armatimonadetes bacterium]|nr:PLP-dependent transferase [Armatimonadota bacterium]
MSANDSHKPDTILQHLGEDTHWAGAVTPPIFQTSLFVHESIDQYLSAHEEGRYTYSRCGNPNLDLAQVKLAALEKAEEGQLYNSGMSAITAAIMSETKAGAHVVCVDTCYGPTRIFLETYLPKFGVTTTFVSGHDPQEIFDACKPETTLIYLESPSSLIFQFQDLRAISAFAKERGIATCIDNSYASPIYQQPITMGIDHVVHSGTKYIAGHSDVVCGLHCTSAEKMAVVRKNEMELIGAALPPFPSWLVLRGLRTLKLRMERAQETGNTMCQFLKGRSEVTEVFHASDQDHPQHDLFKSQMSGSGSLITFAPAFQDEIKVRQFVESLEIYQMGVSWGGYESLAMPLKVKPMHWKEERLLVRLYCGLEDVGDLMDDLDQAFKKIG